MSEEKQYYVYVHRKATDGSVFYVGKGKGKRAWHKHQRPQYWSRVSAKYGFTAHIVMRFEHEKCSFSFERALIKYYGRENLCNHTDGGDGPSGLKHSNYSKYKMSIAKKKIGVSKEIISALKISRLGRNNSESHNNKISIANKGKKRSEEERIKMSIRMKGKFKGKDNPSANKTEYTFYHDEHGNFIGTPIEFRDKYDLKGGSVGRIINGTRKSFKGWIISP